MKFTKAFYTELLKNPTKRLKLMSEHEIAELLQHESHLYYSEGKPNLTDDMFDMVKAHLESINPKHPILHHVGSYVHDDDSRKTKLPFYMGSLDKIKSDDHALEQFKSKFKGSYVVSDKLDGNSALFVYKNKKPELFSRGNGTYGQNISHLLPFIGGIPQSLTHDIAVRGELIMSKYNFEQVKDKGANARNMVAGLVNSKVPNLDISRRVVFVAYTLLDPANLAPSKQFEYMKKHGFVSVDYIQIDDKTMTFGELSSILMTRREQGLYEIDGLVVTHDKYHKHEKDRNPEYAFAFKHLLNQEMAEVIVKHVEWNVSKDAYIKPVVVFDPVRLSGVYIKRATGFNAEYIKDNKIGPGARIIITRSGDVIPYIVRVSIPAQEAQLPNDVEYKWTESGKDIFVPNENEMVDFKKLEAFFKKLEIKGVGPATARAIFDAGFTTIKQVIELDQNDIQNIPNLKNKATLLQNIKAALEKLDCVVLMEASNAFGRGFGEKKLRSIIDAIPKISTNKYIPTMDEMLNVNGVSDITAKKFITGLHAYHAFLKNVTTLKCVQTNAEKTKDANQGSGSRFEGETIVFTGFRNKEWESLIKNNGGHTTTTISSKTTMLVVASLDKGSSKLEAAKQKGIKILTREEFESKYVKN